ncbi:class I SAM-dependent methyltransferase [Chryseolinea sp. H1M3-3]|uniref:class I SAM-dependent methyltransferase n=1 Tax=Chryseolinea sp. H1M3-3 TaxID=3034144 RepID=UPI0023EAD9D4|nr:class I SAM-dependent methyltransferase [Chryseolinea sp. H1M3-3]
MNTFDKVAPFYDRLSRIVFGSSIHNAQIYYLTKVPREAKVLMVGGGTGRLLSELMITKPECQVWYIDASHKMIELAKRKTKKFGNRITFIHGTENSIPQDIIFDSVITPFYLDLFSQENCAQAIHKIQRSLNAQGIWIATDFVNTTWWHSVMLFLMYWFFKFTCSIETMTLPNWERLMSENGFLEVEFQTFYGGFIKTVRFRSKFSRT